VLKTSVDLHTIYAIIIIKVIGKMKKSKEMVKHDSETTATNNGPTRSSLILEASACPSSASLLKLSSLALDLRASG